MDPMIQRPGLSLLLLLSVRPVTVVATAVCVKLDRFVTLIHFYPCLIFVGKDRSLPLKWSPARGSTKPYG